MEAIAKEAGAGVGTLYRHFLRRIDIVEAVYRGSASTGRWMTYWAGPSGPAWCARTLTAPTSCSSSARCAEVRRCRRTRANDCSPWSWTAYVSLASRAVQLVLAPSKGGRSNLGSAGLKLSRTDALYLPTLWLV